MKRTQESLLCVALTAALFASIALAVGVLGKRIEEQQRTECEKLILDGKELLPSVSGGWRVLEVGWGARSSLATLENRRGVRVVFSAGAPPCAISFELRANDQVRFRTFVPETVSIQTASEIRQRVDLYEPGHDMVTHWVAGLRIERVVLKDGGLPAEKE